MAQRMPQGTDFNKLRKFLDDASQPGSVVSFLLVVMHFSATGRIFLSIRQLVQFYGTLIQPLLLLFGPQGETSSLTIADHGTP